MRATATGRRLAVVVALLALATASAWVPAGTGHHRRPLPLHAPRAVHARVADSHYCDDCQPPLVYQEPGAPVADTTGPGGVTITPVFWLPAGATPFAPSYQAVVEGFVRDLAASSGATDDVFSVLTQYDQVVGGVRTPLRNVFTAGAAVVDTQPFPDDGCRADDGFDTCLTDAQLRTELSRLAATGAIAPAGLSTFFPVFTPPGVETQDLDGTTSVSGFCGYHRSFGSGRSEIAYGDEVYEPDGCGEGQSPNGSVPADSAVSTLTHEISEFLTDPETDRTAWVDASGAEVGDICANDFGVPLGGSDGHQYNQVIGSGKYYVQTEFSNAAFRAQGAGHGCQQGAAAAPTAPVAELFSEATPNAVPADGATTSEVDLTVTDASGDGIGGDAVSLSTYAVTGSGRCGRLDVTSGRTDDSGELDVHYTASRADAVCAVVAKEARGGRSTTATVYQGTREAQAPTATATFPASVRADGSPVVFTATYGNRGDEPLTSVAEDLVVFDGSSGHDVPAEDVSLAYSLTGADGPFTPLDLVGSTVGDGGIQSVAPIGGATGGTIAPRSSLTVTYRFTLATGAAAARTSDLLSFEGYLYTLNPGAGTTTTIADTLASDVTVPGSSTGSGLVPAVFGGAAGAGVLVAVAAVVRRRRRRRA